MINRQTVLLLLLVSVAFCSFNAATSRAQVVASAIKSPISLTVGGTASIFDPHYIQDNLEGVGAYADLNLFHGIGVEAEGRWLRFHQYYGVNQDNYFIGPRVQLHRVWVARPYVKVLGGFSHMNLGDYGEFVGTGRFTSYAFGGGADIHLTRRFSIRAIDGEYQLWPNFLGGHLSPYGISAGVGYRLF